MHEETARAIRQAAREGWATYMPTGLVLLAGLLAALAVLLSPLVVFLTVIVIAVAGELVTVGWVDWYTTVYVNLRSFGDYVALEWPFIAAGAALGIPAALLRQRRGFYFRRVRGVAASGKYKRRFLLPVYPHTALLWAAGPAILWGMAYHANPTVYPELLYNAFAVWLTSGVLACWVWERLQVGLLKAAARFAGPPRRSLSAEFQLKQLIEGDPALSYYRVWDVAVDTRQGRAVVYGNVAGEGPLRRLHELARFIDGVQTLEVSFEPRAPLSAGRRPVRTAVHG